MSDYCWVMTTAGDEETAAHLASSAVEQKLAASAQVIGPVNNFFWHLGEAGQGEEWQVVLKTTMARYDDVEQHIIAEHSWDKPEVAAIPLVGGSKPYLQWLADSTASTS